MKNKESFRVFLWDSFNKSVVVYVTIFGFIASFIFWINSPDSIIKFKYAIPIFFLLIILLMTFINLAYDIHRNRNPQLPHIIRGMKPYGKFINAYAILLIGQSVLFSSDSIVSYYYIGDEGFEQLVGFGSVFIVQDDKNIQVIIEQVVEGHEDIVEKLSNNDKAMLSKIIVRPNVPKSFLTIRGVQ